MHVGHYNMLQLRRLYWLDMATRLSSLLVAGHSGLPGAPYSRRSGKSVDGLDVIGDQALRVARAVVDGVAIVVCLLAVGELVAPLPEQIAGDARRGAGGRLPRLLDVAVVGAGSVWGMMLAPLRWWETRRRAGTCILRTGRAFRLSRTPLRGPGSSRDQTRW